MYWKPEDKQYELHEEIIIKMQPTISIYQLVDEEYQVNQFRDNDKIVSTVFPNLDFTAKQIFQAV